MNKSLIVAGTFFGVTLGAAILVRRFAQKSGGSIWEKMIERMPDAAPPKWMFRNIATIRENTDRILELLESKGVPAVGNREEEKSKHILS